MSKINIFEKKKHKFKRSFQISIYLLLNSVESPISLPNGPSSSPFRFLNIKKKISKSFRSNPTDGPKLICTNESTTPPTTTNGLTVIPPPDVG